MNEGYWKNASYDEAVHRISEKLASEKQTRHLNDAMHVAIEGLSNTGKSTLSKSLESKLRDSNFKVVSIEGDLFQKGREETMLVYRRVLEELGKGIPVPSDFPSQVWNYHKMQYELFAPLDSFKENRADSGRIVLNNVLIGKKPGTEHTETYEVDRETLVLTSGMYLRHMRGFDFVLFLDADPEVLIERKIRRDASLGVKRDPNMTRDMVERIEVPAMKKHLAESKNGKGVAVDVNDFNSVSGFNLDNYTSPYLI